MKQTTSTLSGKATQLLKGVALFSMLLLLAGCDVAGGTGDPVRLVVTPVATPSPTQPAPPTAVVAPVTYTVKAGDTLSGIAELFGVTVDEVVRVNNIADPNAVAEGQVLTIPARSLATATQSPAGTPGAEDTQPPGANASPTLPPPDVTPPQGPPIVEPTQGVASPAPDTSPTAEP